MHAPSLSLIVAFHLRSKFPERSLTELLVLWDSTWCWVCKHVWRAHTEHPIPALLEAAAFMYMQHLIEKDPQKKAAYLYDAHELLMPYKLPE